MSSTSPSRISPVPETGDIDYRLTGNLADLGLPVAGYQVTGGHGTISVADPGLIELDGDLQLNGVPATGSWRLALAGDTEERETLEITARLDEDDRAALGLVDPFASTGDIDVSLSRTVAGNGAATWRLNADLRDLAIGADAVLGAKLPGEPGSAHLVAIEDDGAFIIRAFDIQSGSTAVRASGAIAPQSVRLDIARLAFGRTDVAGSARNLPGWCLVHRRRRGIN